ncbi:MAG: hypothetical protein ACP5S8_04195 [Hydrogenobaculum sp.]
MVKHFDEIKHLLEEGEELLFSAFDSGIYHMLTYNKAYNTLFYFKARKLGNDQKYYRTSEKIITPLSLKEKLSHILSPKAIEFLEKSIMDNRRYAT